MTLQELYNEKTPCDGCDRENYLHCQNNWLDCKALRLYTAKGRIFPQHMGKDKRDLNEGDVKEEKMDKTKQIVKKRGRKGKKRDIKVVYRETAEKEAKWAKYRGK